MVTVAEVQVRHLAEALSSVHAQDGVRPEVLVAPWGAWREPLPPGALPVSESLADARRAGLAAAASPYVRFLEATDTVPAPSTRLLLDALRERGAVSAAGVSERIDATWRDRAHAPDPEAALELGARLFGVTEEVRPVLDRDHGRWADAVLARLDRDDPPATVPDVVHHDHHREHGLPFGHLPRRADDVHALAATVRAVADEIGSDDRASLGGRACSTAGCRRWSRTSSRSTSTPGRRSDSSPRQLWERADLGWVRVEATARGLAGRPRTDATT